MRRSHFMLVLAVCVAWGANFLAAARALTRFPPFLCTALRLAVVLMCLLPLVKPIPRDHRLRIVTIASLNGVLHFGLIFAALRVAGDISSVAIALQSYVPMSALLAMVLLGEKIESRVWTGILLAFVGVLILGFDPLALDAPAALLLTLGSALALALATTLTKSVRGVGPFELQAWSAIIGVPALLAISFAWESEQLAAFTSANWLDYASIAYSAIGSSIFGHGSVFWLVQRYSVAQVTPYLLLSPLFSVALGILVWGDEPGAQLLVGGVMVLLGVLLGQLSTGTRMPSIFTRKA